MSVSDTSTLASTDFASDSERQTFTTAASAYWSRLRSGELGAIPAILAIGVLVAVFGTARPDSFMSVRNLGNLLQQAAPIMVISMAVAFVLLLGEIDLAAGFTAGVTAAVLATKLRASWGLPKTLLLCAVVGSVTTILRRRVCMLWSPHDNKNPLCKAFLIVLRTGIELGLLSDMV